MQLDNSSTNIAASLALATCTLLGSTPALANESVDNEWRFDTAILYYGETDRVSLVEGVISATKDFGGCSAASKLAYPELRFALSNWD